MMKMNLTKITRLCLYFAGIFCILKVLDLENIAEFLLLGLPIFIIVNKDY